MELSEHIGIASQIIAYNFHYFFLFAHMQMCIEVNAFYLTNCFSLFARTNVYRSQCIFISQTIQTFSIEF